MLQELLDQATSGGATDRLVIEPQWEQRECKSLPGCMVIVLQHLANSLNLQSDIFACFTVRFTLHLQVRQAIRPVNASRRPQMGRKGHSELGAEGRMWAGSGLSALARQEPKSGRSRWPGAKVRFRPNPVVRRWITDARKRTFHSYRFRGSIWPKADRPV